MRMRKVEEEEDDSHQIKMFPRGEEDVRVPHNVFITLRISNFPRVSLGIIHTIWGGLSVMTS